jgi:uncharacterized membrane protein
MEHTNPLALTIIVIGALMGFGREWLVRWYLWIFKKTRHREPPPRLEAGIKLYLVMMSLIFTMVGLMGVFGIWKY